MRAAFVAIGLLLVTMGAAAGPAVQTRTVERLVALPTPLGPVTALDDGHVWTVTMGPGVVVFVDARGSPQSLFHLRASPEGATDPVPLSAPTHADGELLRGPGTWRVSVDPTAGAAVRIDVTFTGSFGDIGGAPAGFTLTDVRGGNPCVLPGVCLP